MSHVQAVHLSLPARSWTVPHAPPRPMWCAQKLIDASPTMTRWTPIKQSRSHYCANTNISSPVPRFIDCWQQGRITIAISSFKSMIKRQEFLARSRTRHRSRCFRGRVPVTTGCHQGSGRKSVTTSNACDPSVPCVWFEYTWQTNDARLVAG